MRTINIPYWCLMRKIAEFEIYDSDSEKPEWYRDRDKIISDLDHHPFYGKIIREIDEN